MVKIRTHPVTLLKPDDPVSFSPFASTTENCGYLLTCKKYFLIFYQEKTVKRGHLHIRCHTEMQNPTIRDAVT
jgi:hypothetical protein